MGFSINDMYAGAKEPSQGLTFIGPGTHLLALADFKATNAANEAPKFRADFAVIESDFHKPGEIVSTMFQPYGTLFKGMGETEAGRMMVMVKALNGDMEMSRQLAGAETEKMLDLAQPARGFRCAATGYEKAPKPNADGTPKTDKNGNPKGPFTVVSFFPAVVANTLPQVQADRAKIESLPQMQARTQPAAPQTPAAQQPPQGQWQQPQAAAPQTPPTDAPPPSTGGNGSSW